MGTTARKRISEYFLDIYMENCFKSLKETGNYKDFIAKHPENKPLLEYNGSKDTVFYAIIRKSYIPTCEAMEIYIESVSTERRNIRLDYARMLKNLWVNENLTIYEIWYFPNAEHIVSVKVLKP